MKEFNISVKVEGYEYYTVIAKSEEDAISMIKRGEVVCDVCDTEWCGDFDVDSEEDLGDDK